MKNLITAIISAFLLSACTAEITSSGSNSKLTLPDFTNWRAVYSEAEELKRSTDINAPLYNEVSLSETEETSAGYMKTFKTSGLPGTSKIIFGYATGWNCSTNGLDYSIEVVTLNDSYEISKVEMIQMNALTNATFETTLDSKLVVRFIISNLPSPCNSLDVNFIYEVQ